MNDTLEDEATIINFLETQTFDSKLNSLLESLDECNLSGVAKLIHSLKPSANTLKEILTLASEIAKRDDCDLGAVLLSTEFTTLLEKPKLSRKDRQKLTKNYLKQKRYPHLQDIQNKLSDSQKKLAEKYGLRINFPENLEGDTINIQIKARQPEDFTEAAKKLDCLAKDTLTRTAFAVLTGTEE